MANWTCNICAEIWYWMGSGEPRFCAACGSENIRKYAEVVLSRDAYKAAMIGVFIEKKYHPEDADREAEMALAEFAQHETETWGDPNYYWDCDSAREHAHNWLEIGK